MMTICAFSSDRRVLYKADIHRALALPVGHVLHFRYKTKYVDNAFVRDPSSLKGKEVVIFYTVGNTGTGEEKLSEATGTTPKLKHISVRTGTVSVAEIDDETEVFHVYMKMGAFTNVVLDSNNSTERMPGQKFLSELTVTPQTSGDTWKSRVDAISPCFDPILFFNIKSISGERRNPQVKYRNKGRDSYLKLTHGERYELELLMSNVQSGNTNLNIETLNTEILVHSSQPIHSSIQYDKMTVPVSVRQIEATKQSSSLIFESNVGEELMAEYSIVVEVELKKSFSRSIVFGVFTSLGVIALALAKALFSIEGWGSILNIGLCATCFFASAAGLFYFFNKK